MPSFCSTSCDRTSSSSNGLPNSSGANPAMMFSGLFSCSMRTSAWQQRDESRRSTHVQLVSRRLVNTQGPVKQTPGQHGSTSQTTRRDYSTYLLLCQASNEI